MSWQRWDLAEADGPHFLLQQTMNYIADLHSIPPFHGATRRTAVRWTGRWPPEGIHGIGTGDCTIPLVQAVERAAGAC